MLRTWYFREDYEDELYQFKETLEEHIADYSDLSPEELEILFEDEIQEIWGIEDLVWHCNNFDLEITNYIDDDDQDYREYLQEVAEAKHEDELFERYREEHFDD